jgi:hypothetical protein
LNLPVDEALVRIGLDVQYFCTADPAGWDPVNGKSPVHLAGKIHQKALAAALRRLEDKGQKTEDGSQRTEVRGRKSEDRGQMSEDGSQKTEY